MDSNEGEKHVNDIYVRRDNSRSAGRREVWTEFDSSSEESNPYAPITEGDARTK